MDVLLFTRPQLAKTGRERYALIVFECVSRVTASVEIVCTEVERAFPVPLETLGQVEQFASHVGFQACIEIVSASFALDTNHSAGEISIFHRGYAAHDLHAFDIICGDGSHICTLVCEVSRGGFQLPRTREKLHVGIVTDRSAVKNKTCSER